MIVALYVETSAVLTWVFGEPAGGHAIEVMNSAPLVVSSTLTMLECERAILRAEREHAIAEAQSVTLRRLFRDVLRGWELMEITPEVQRRAAEAFPVEPVRSLDAIHLSTVLHFLELYDDISVLSFDSRILDNVPLLGLATA